MINVLAISGSTRKDSTNTALLQSLVDVAHESIRIEIFHGTDSLPIFSQDLEGDNTPIAVLDFCGKIASADAIILASPEYVRAVPGGLKNAIDWLVSREEIMHKPVVLAHASHRGDDMLASLRLILKTVSTRFYPDIFLRVCLLAKSPRQVRELLAQPQHKTQIDVFLSQLSAALDDAVV